MAFFKGAAKEGQRVSILQKKREQEKNETDFQKKKLEQDMRLGDISRKFAAHYDSIEQKLSTETVGLVTLDEMKAKQEAALQERERELAVAQMKSNLTGDAGAGTKEISVISSANLRRKAVLSFAETEDDEDDLAEELVIKKRRFGMNPSVDTSFLPDVERDLEEKRLRQELRQEWVSRQERMREEEMSVTYSYWDGSGHRRDLIMKKGHTIAQFLHRALEQLRGDFVELRPITHDQLMYVKEDLIIPHHYTFYDFIVSKARGKSGPLFVFDAHEDVRLRHDAAVAKDESHAGKVCLRSWYERNKHIFPASRWEPYDPAKKWDDEYTHKDRVKQQ